MYESNSYTPLLIDGKYDEMEALKCWDKIYDEYIDVFGLDKGSVLMFKIRKKLFLAKCNMALSKTENERKRHLNKVRDLQSEIELMTNKEKSNMYDVITLIEENMGFTIEEDKVTVIKFYTYLKRLNEQNRK